MALPTHIEFLKVLACTAWADGELARSEIHLIGRLMHDFHLSGEERLEVEMYLEEKVDGEEAKRIVRRFLARVRRPSQRRKLVETVDTLLASDQQRTPEEHDWLRELRETVADSGGSFLIDGLRSVLRIGADGPDSGERGREAHLHDFIHNRVLFKLRHRVGAKILEQEAKPENLKELTLCAAFLARVGYVDEEFLPQEKHFIRKLLHDIWKISPALAEAVCDVAMETADRGLDSFRLIQEAKRTLSGNQRKLLVEALFGIALAEQKMTGREIEEIRKIAYGLDLTHREFISAKLKVLGRDGA